MLKPGQIYREQDLNGRDFINRLIITKGTTVRVRTANGGEITGPLAANHYPTFGAMVVAGKGVASIDGYRITSVEVV